MVDVNLGGLGRGKRTEDDAAALRSGEPVNAVLGRRLLSEFDGRRIEIDRMERVVRDFIDGWHGRMILAGALVDEPLAPYGVRYDEAARRVTIYDPTRGDGDAMTTNPMREVTEEDLLAFVAAYPHPLTRDVYAVADPPSLTWNDFTRGKWPASVVAQCHINREQSGALEGPFCVLDESV